MKFLKRTLLIMLIPFSQAFSQDSTSFFHHSKQFNKKRFISVSGLQAVGYGGSLVLLGTAWYKDYPNTVLHSFDDSHEWLQMDKAGHIITSWYLGKMGNNMYEWSGMSKRKSVLYGALSGWSYLAVIELFDGFSKGWGFSWSDLGANTVGTVLTVGQQILQHSSTYSVTQKEIRFVADFFCAVSVKFSFHKTKFPPFRPSLLGNPNSLAEQIVKDYNGQTYWLSFNLSSLMNQKSKFPKWLNFAFGYGAEGMISGNPGYVYTNPHGEQIEFIRYRQYYLSLDIDITRIKTKSYFLKTIAETFCFIKIPAPALEFCKHGIKSHPLYF